jgi:hypothetical protein
MKFTIVNKTHRRYFSHRAGDKNFYHDKPVIEFSEKLPAEEFIFQLDGERYLEVIPTIPTE